MKILNNIQITMNSTIPTQILRQTLSKNVNNEETLQLSGYKESSTILFRNNIVFRSNQQPSLKDAVCKIELTSDKIEPQAFVEIKTRKDFPEQIGVRAVFMFAFNDQMLEQKDSEIKMSYFKQGLRKRELNFSFDVKNTKNALNTLEKEFLQTKLKQEHINMAKQIASSGLFLYRKTGEFQEEYKGIPENITEEQYENIIDKISISDIEKYNQDFLKNSKINIKIKINKNDYIQNQDTIHKYLDKTKTSVYAKNEIYNI